MTSDFNSIGKYIKEIAGADGKSNSVLGYIEKVDLEKMVCSVVSADKSYTYYNVRLKEITQDDAVDNGFLLVPKQNSRVIIDFIAPSEAYVSMVSEIEKMYVIVDKMRMAVTAQGLSLESKQYDKDLSTVIGELLTFLKTEYKVQTAWGPSGPALPDAGVKLDQFKSDFAKLFVKGADNDPS